MWSDNHKKHTIKNYVKDFPVCETRELTLALRGTRQKIPSIAWTIIRWLGGYK